MEYKNYFKIFKHFKIVKAIKILELEEIKKIKASIGGYRKDYSPYEIIHKTRLLTKKQKQKLPIQYLKKIKSYPDALKTKDIAIIIG